MPKFEFIIHAFLPECQAKSTLRWNWIYSVYSQIFPFLFVVGFSIDPKTGIVNVLIKFEAEDMHMNDIFLYICKNVKVS